MIQAKQRLLGEASRRFLALKLFYPFLIRITNGPEGEDGDASKCEHPQKCKEHVSGDGVLCN